MKKIFFALFITFMVSSCKTNQIVRIEKQLGISQFHTQKAKETEKANNDSHELNYALVNNSGNFVLKNPSGHSNITKQLDIIEKNITKHKIPEPKALWKKIFNTDRKLNKTSLYAFSLLVLGLLFTFLDSITAFVFACLLIIAAFILAIAAIRELKNKTKNESGRTLAIFTLILSGIFCLGLILFLLFWAIGFFPFITPP